MSVVPDVDANTSAAAAAWSLDGSHAQEVMRPSSEADAVDAVSRAARDGVALVPVGGGTALETGNLIRADRWAIVDTARMSGILEYTPEDMVVTVGAGTTLAQLQAELAMHNQFLPLDTPHADRATLGGITAVNAQGLLRPGFGLPRDRLLSARIVLSDGTVARAGAKVVKNVAGYDLCKLIAGSWGTLGLITEVTYKTNPLPPAGSVMEFECAALNSMALLAAAALDIHTARIQPAFLAVTGPECARLYVGLLGGETAVAWQRDEIRRKLGEMGVRLVDTGDDPDRGPNCDPGADRAAHWERETGRLAGFIASRGEAVSARITARPSELPQLLETLRPSASAILCHIATGVVEAAMSPLAVPKNETEGLAWSARIRGALPTGSHLVWSRVPTPWKQTLDVWGSPGAQFPLMQGIKKAFDPISLFSPGRFYGRL